MRVVDGTIIVFTKFNPVVAEKEGFHILENCSWHKFELNGELGKTVILILG